ncbi:hypothetical protein V501_01898 [Pseudogymnoascus sp. VKM F-4519 (FW-2642)]|nr:hypothetical protein V501_01898 [Pseudogymnoascus sp. VKM F-4519 (FW-2642)]
MTVVPPATAFAAGVTVDEKGGGRTTPEARRGVGKAADEGLTIVVEDGSSGTHNGDGSSGTDTEKALVPLEEPRGDLAPDGGYGWVVVFCVFMINAHTWGINSSYGIFLSYYLSHDVFPGSTPLHYAFIGGLSIAMSQTIAPLATYLINRRGIYVTLWLGVILQTAALLGASWSVQIWQLFLSQGVCFGLGMGLIFNATVGLIPQWFDRKRSFANSIGTAGSGMGGLIYSLATQAMIRSIGLEWAFRVLAIASCTVCAIASLLICDRNVAVGSVYHALDLRLLQRPHFLLTLAWAGFSIIGYVNLLFSLPNYAISIGLSAQQASIVGALLNLGQGIGRPLIGLRDSLLRAVDPGVVIRCPPRLRAPRRWLSRDVVDDRRASDGGGDGYADPAIGAEFSVGVSRATEYVRGSHCAGAEEGEEAGVCACAGVYGDDVCGCGDVSLVCEGMEDCGGGEARGRGD